MKNLFYYFIFTSLFYATATYAQTVPWNLVKNYSFEDHNSCDYPPDPIDTNTSFQAILPNWFSATILGTPDYFNTCYHTINGGVDVYDYAVPNNPFAFQSPYNGIGFAAIIPSNYITNTNEWREYLQTKLATPLKKNKKYCVGMYANHAFDITKPTDDVKATKDLSILLSKIRPLNGNIGINDNLILVDNPQVSPATYITDTLNWTPIIGIVTAQGGEQWLTIGSFKPKWQTDVITVLDKPNNDSFWMYYFIDDVFVIPMENDQALLHKDTTICTNGFPIQIQANTGFTGYTWNNGTTGSSLMVAQEGTYTVSATYAGCTIVDTIRVKTTGVPNLTMPNYNICDNELPLAVSLPPAITDVFDTFSWSNNTVGATTVLNTADIYTVTATMECGSTSKSFMVTTAPEPPTFSLGNDTSLCVNAKPRPIILKSNLALTNYLWSTGATTPNITVAETGIYTLSTTNACGTKTDNISIEGCPPNYYIPNTFTPNGDGYNDIFNVFASDAIVNIKKMQVFDRWGEAVFAADNLPSFGGAGGGWDGTFHNQSAITDVYVYVIVLEFADGTTETVSGDVTLLR
jgi:gliding motility-associated-like protein